MNSLFLTFVLTLTISSSPNTDGLDIMQKIRNLYYNIPVIISTACSDLSYDPRSMVADYFVMKNFNLKGLKLRIKMALHCRKVFQTELAPETFQELHVVSF